jgi:hypothetical protein
LFSPTGDRYRVIIREEAGAVSWLQQLVGKLKSVFGSKSSPEEAATEAGTTPRAEVAEAPTAATATEDKTEKAEAPAPAASVKDASALETTEPPAEPTDAAEEPVSTEAETVEPAVADSSEVAPDPASAVEATAEVVPTADSAGDAEPVVTTAAEEPAIEVEPVVEAESATAAAAKREATNPAISTLDVEGITAELKAEGPYGPGSGKPAADGSAPSADFTVKGKESSKLFHTAKSPYFTRTKADVWFKSEADAESAGFQPWDHKKRAGAKK